MTDYNVIAEVDVAPTKARMTAWLDALAPYSPAVSRTDRGVSEIVVTIPAKSIEQAARTGMQLLLGAAGQLRVGTFQVMTTEEYDRRSDDVALPDLVGATEAAEILGLTRQRVQQMATAGSLPSVKVGKALVFPRATIEARARAGAR